MKLLDLFCGAGGAAMGYYQAGITDITGVDIEYQSNYPYKFIQADALDFDVSRYDVIHASPPCQAYTWAASFHRNRGIEYPDLISQTRELLIETKVSFIIENVAGAPIRHDLMLCGTMFGLELIRHRYFEIEGFRLPQPFHMEHKPPVLYKTRKGNIRKRSQYCCVSGHGGEGASYMFEDWQKAMMIFHMTKQELVQAIPPVYTHYIGRFIK